MPPEFHQLCSDARHNHAIELFKTLGFVVYFFKLVFLEEFGGLLVSKGYDWAGEGIVDFDKLLRSEGVKALQMVKDEGAEPFSLFVFANGYQIYLQKVDMLMKHTPTNNSLIAADHYRPKLSIQHFVGDEFVFYAGEVGIEKAGEG